MEKRYSVDIPWIKTFGTGMANARSSRFQIYRIFLTVFRLGDSIQFASSSTLYSSSQWQNKQIVKRIEGHKQKTQTCKSRKPLTMPTQNTQRHLQSDRDAPISRPRAPYDSTAMHIHSTLSMKLILQMKPNSISPAISVSNPAKLHVALDRFMLCYFASFVLQLVVKFSLKLRKCKLRRKRYSQKKCSIN